jgi:hypothetical protein
MRRIILIGLLLSSLAGYSQTCSTITAYDYMETWNWTGDWWIPAATTNFYTNASVSPSTSAVLYGTGGGSSANEVDWYSMPNRTGLNLSSAYHFKFRLGSYRFTSTSATRGVDVGDFIEVQLSTNGGVTYTSEIRVTGNSNAYWSYNTNGTINKIANGTLTTYSPTGGGDRTLTGDGYSVIDLTLPSGITQCAVDIYCRANAAGEEWWIDNIELIEYFTCAPLPIELIYFTAQSVGSRVVLDWTTASELNNDHFILERSTDALQWTEIGRVDGVGTTSQLSTYHFIDAHPNIGANYYRLSQVDFDGTQEFFNLVYAEISDPRINCKYSYFDIAGQEVNYDFAPPGIYFRLCGETIEKIIKN